MNINEELQSLLETSFKHVMNQGKPSIGPSIGPKACMYKTDEGLHCAAYPFIKNYSPAMEGHAWHSLVRDFPNDIEPRAAKNRSFVSILQSVHDCSSSSHRDGKFIKTYLNLLKRQIERWNRMYPTKKVEMPNYDN